jgi:hypothetical protein
MWSVNGGVRKVRQLIRHTRDEQGMTTAEYAVGTVASCGLAGVLLNLISQPWLATLLKELFEATIGKFI